MVRSFHVVEIVGTTCELVGTSRVCFNYVVQRDASRPQVTGIWTVADGRPTEYWINKIMNKVSFVNDLCTHSREKWLIIQNFPFKPCIQTPMTPIYLPVIVPISCAHGLANGDTHTLIHAPFATVRYQSRMTALIIFSLHH